MPSSVFMSGFRETIEREAEAARISRICSGSVTVSIARRSSLRYFRWRWPSSVSAGAISSSETETPWYESVMLAVFSGVTIPPTSTPHARRSAMVFVKDG